MLARPWKTIARAGSTAQVALTLAHEIAGLAAEDDGLATVVFGWPRHLDGEPSDQAPAIEALIEGLRGLVSIPITTQDERLSSHEAESLLARRHKDWQKRKAMLDATAAAVILQDYLDGRARVAALEPESESQ